MPANNPTNVSLDIRNFPSNGDGWTNVMASNGQTYSYKYSGGNQPTNNGSIVYGIGGGHAATTLMFAANTDARYRFAEISFVNDNANQLTAQGNAPRTRAINDRCDAAIDARYKVTVLDTTENVTIPCDPMIQNKPV
ncbi:MAG: hypothetical protein EPN36_12735 [Rhodanobacteraceae bacterium]|nr:MAG: hypothetical protein EPN36_12735 [Rhodanobacteraceae bacterium]